MAADAIHALISGMQHVHRAGIVHRDMKVSARRSTLQVTPLAQPENVMLRTEVGPLVIIDFGLALPISMLKKGSPIGYI